VDDAPKGVAMIERICDDGYETVKEARKLAWQKALTHLQNTKCSALSSRSIFPDESDQVLQ
jgi:hypothetical protein